MNYTKIRTALRVPLSGTYNNNTVYGGDGGFWSSTYYVSDSYYYMYDFYATTSNITALASAGRRNGIAVRCIVKN